MPGMKAHEIIGMMWVEMFYNDFLKGTLKSNEGMRKQALRYSLSLTDDYESPIRCGMRRLYTNG